jgi:hypothetical protein
MSFEVQKRKKTDFFHDLILIGTTILVENYLKGRIYMCSVVTAGQHGVALRDMGGEGSCRICT